VLKPGDTKHEVTVIEIGEAQKQVLEEIPVLGQERIHILEALRRVLAQDVTACATSRLLTILRWTDTVADTETLSVLTQQGPKDSD